MNADSRVASASALSSSSRRRSCATVAPSACVERVQPRAGAIAGQRALGRHREDRRLGHDRAQVLAREAQRLGQLGLVQQVDLGDDEDQPVARRAQDALLEELALGRGQDLRRVEQEHRRVGARQVAVGDLGALLVDVVDPGRVDQRQPVLQHGRRVCRSRRGGWPSPGRLARGFLSLSLASPSTVSQSPSAAASIGLRSPDSVTAVGARARAVRDVRQQRGRRRDAGRQHRRRPAAR